MVASYRAKGAIRMSAVEGVDRLIERFNLAQGDLVKGNAEPANELFSPREDVTLANPYGPPVRGWDEVAAVVERARAKVGGSEDITPITLRVTMIFRPEEDGEWKIVHRHADPITTPRPAESVIQQ